MPNGRQACPGSSSSSGVILEGCGGRSICYSHVEVVTFPQLARVLRAISYNVYNDSATILNYFRKCVGLANIPIVLREDWGGDWVFLISKRFMLIRL